MLLRACYMSVFMGGVRLRLLVRELPFLAIFAGGYLYVGVTRVYVLWKMHVESNAEVEGETDLPGDSATEPAA